MPVIERSTFNVIRLARRGCTNRPFYHIVVMRNRQPSQRMPLEHIGTFDPLPNTHNESLVAIDFDKLRKWLGNGAVCSTSVDILLGYAGYFPIHPRTRLQALRVEKKRQQQELEAQKTDSENSEQKKEDTHS